LFRFCSTSSCPEGGFPNGSLIFDAAGNLYGVTHAGGAYGYGTVFELTPNRSGQWRIKVLHDFNNNGMDGYDPQGSLVMDKSGNLYGTTAVGGTHLCDNGASSCGTVFELITIHGQWTEKVLHDFDGTDGAFPEAGLTWGAAGKLYGTTAAGGSINDGTAFELSLNSGKWVEKVLYSFNEGIKDYSVAPWGLTLDPTGNLYGTTNDDGDGVGTVFELIHGSGGWTERVLHTFTGSPDGKLPWAGLVRDSAGHLYGTTAGGGSHNKGIVFEVTP
jgi:uncharacterized repeat protein (TIGR03803 family)